MRRFFNTIVGALLTSVSLHHVRALFILTVLDAEPAWPLHVRIRRVCETVCRTGGCQASGFQRDYRCSMGIFISGVVDPLANQFALAALRYFQSIAGRSCVGGSHNYLLKMGAPLDLVTLLPMAGW